MKRQKSPKTIRLEIACGQVKEQGWIGIDIVKTPQCDIRHDLFKFPWPFADESVSEARCSHFIEHIPHRAFGDSGPDPLFMFFDELYRILVPEGKCTVIAPYYSSMRCWQDPTHTRAISEMTFIYANAEWRKNNKLDHYPIKCDFDFTYGYAMLPEWQNREQTVQQGAIKNYINVVSDIHVTLTKRPITKSSLSHGRNGRHGLVSPRRNGIPVS